MTNDLITMNTVADRMEIIKTIFQDAKDKALAQDDVEELIRHLSTTNPEFISVAYEGASMGLALKDFTNMKPPFIPPKGEKPENGFSYTPLRGEGGLWNSFMNVSENHAAQMYIGLGWAVAQEKKTAPFYSPEGGNSGDASSQIPPSGGGGALMQFRLWDGCGYYDGLFRQRQTIKNQIRHDYIPAAAYQMYDQGLGRSLWYLCKGDETKIPEMIRQFSSSRHPDLWRGVGIACAYVGGCGETIFKTLSSSAEKHFLQLGIGAAMAAKARILANSITKDIDHACKAWCNLSAEEATRIAIKTEGTSGGSFPLWLSQMETEMMKSNS